MIVGSRRRTLFPGALLLALLALGCGGGGDGNTGTGPEEVAPGHVAFIGISGAPASGPVYVGSYLLLTVSTFDRDHIALSGFPVTWTTSDSTVVAVRGPGILLARGAGSAVLTATSDGKSAGIKVTVIAVPIAAVKVTPASAAGVVGAKTQLVATVLDSVGGVLTERSVTWKSSDDAVVRVDGNGLATAIGPGSATITATSEGKSGTAKLSVVARPTADWSGATEDWVTYQLNATHTGYVAATIDPGVFAERWVSNVAPGVALNPVTAADGKVFVSTNAYFGQQQMWVLDLATGAQLWTRDFGGIHSVDPPAYADGTVYVQTGGHQDSFLWGLDAESGMLKFRTSYGNQWERYYAPVVVDGTVFAAGGSYGGMYAFTTEDGAQRWFVGLNQYDMFTPAVSDGRVYAYTGSYSPKLTVADAATGAVAYEIPDPKFSWNGWSMDIAPVLGGSNDMLATQGGRLLSFDLTNRKIGWELAGTFRGSVAVANGVLYVVNNGQVEARRESDGSLLWIWVAPEGQPQGTMVVTKNLLFVATAANTYAVDLAVHAHVWSYPSAAAQLALSRQGVLLIAQRNGKVAAITVK